VIWNKSYAWCKENEKHLEALGETDLVIEAETAPYDKVTRVADGGSRRFNGPCGVYLVIEEGPLTLKWPVDFEGRDANGRGVSLFDRDRLREVMRKLPHKARLAFGAFLTREVLPDLEKRTTELRTALNQQADSEDCVRGLVAFANEPKAKVAA